MSYKLTRQCERDIITIYRRGERLYGLPHADRYQDGLRATLELLATHPKIARERQLANTVVRLHPFRAHLIIYQESSDGILVVRVLYARRDWVRHLGG